jgi:sporulation protein YlmC with PRC-barrel domain
MKLTMISAASRLPEYSCNPAQNLKERAMVAFAGFQTLFQSHADAAPLSQNPRHVTRRSSVWIIWTALAVTLAASPALPQAGVALVKVDLSVVAKGYRMSKLVGTTVINDKNEKIGTIDELIADKDKKQLSLAVLQVGGFLGLSRHLVIVPYDSLVIDETGQKVTLPGASKDELKKLSEFNYPA